MAIVRELEPDEWRSAFLNYTDAELLEATMIHPPKTTPHILATVMLSERKTAKDLRIHYENFAQQERHHQKQLLEQKRQFRHSLLAAWAAAAVAVAAAIVSYLNSQNQKVVPSAEAAKSAKQPIQPPPKSQPATPNDRIAPTVLGLPSQTNATPATPPATPPQK